MILFSLIFGIVITFVVVFCYIITIAFTLWMAIDAGKQDRFWWLVIIIGVPIIGPGAYYFTEKKHEYVKVEPHHIHTSETEEQHEHAPKKRSPRKTKEKVETKNEQQEVLQQEMEEVKKEDSAVI